jgi:hypothetical protein
MRQPGRTEARKKTTEDTEGTEDGGVGCSPAGPGDGASGTMCHVRMIVAGAWGEAGSRTQHRIVCGDERVPASAQTVLRVLGQAHILQRVAHEQVTPFRIELDRISLFRCGPRELPRVHLS